MPELIRLNIPFIVVLLLTAVSFALIYFFYRRTNPEISPQWKWLLIFLRTTVLFLILLLFFQPSIHLFYYQKKYPSVEIFVDNSQSMTIRDGQKPRWQQVQDVIRILNEHLRPPLPVRYFAFNSRVQAVRSPEKIKPSQGGTNFVPVLKRLQKDAPDAAFIISDGVVTEGGLPGDMDLAPRTTVYAIPVGRAHSESDVFIQDAQFAPVAYQNQAQTVAVIVATNHWPQKQRAVLTVWNGKKALARQIISLPPGNGQIRVPLTYVPKKRGLQQLTIRISGLKEDANPYNNVFRFVQNVLKNRIRIALLASAPNYDVKFFRLLLRENPRFSVHWFVEDNQGRFLQKTKLSWLDSSDVWLFAEYPGVRSSAVMLARLRAVWQKHHASLALMLGDNTYWPSLKRLFPHLPFQTLLSAKKEKQVSALVQENVKTNAFTNLFADRALNRLFWNRIPPVTNFYHKLTFRAKHTDLVKAVFNGTFFPLVSLQEQAGSKFLLFNGSGFWRWHFLMQNESDVSRGYTLFLEKLMRWLATRQSFKPVQLTVNRRSGHIGQSFDVTVRLLDAQFKPVPNASVLLKAQLGQQSFELSPRQTEPGVFRAQFVPPAAGTYRLQVTGFQQEKVLGSDSLQIAVVPVDKEFIHLSPDTLFLQRLSASGGGTMLRPAELKSFLQNYFKKPHKVLKEKRIELWYRPEWLILLILLMAIEWALRKKLNLV